MKAFMILVICACVSIPQIWADIESDLDFELYKNLDVTPVHTSFDHDVDFDEPYSSYDSTYDGGGSDAQDENDEANDSNTKKQKPNDDSLANHSAKKNAGDYDDDGAADSGEENEGAENDDDDTTDDDGGEPEDAADDDDDDDDDDGDDEESPDESKIETTTIKAIDPKAVKTVDPDSYHYISPTDVSHRLSRQKRSKKSPNSEDENDHFAQSYRDFVREHFGVDEAKALSDQTDDKKKKKKKQQEYVDDDDDGEAEEDEDYEEKADDGEAEDYDADASGVAASAATDDDYYDDDDEDDDEEEDDGSEEGASGGNAYDGNVEESDEDEDYKKVKNLSQDTDENPKYCKVIYKDNQECQVCKNPKTHDKSETCQYSSSPAPKRYAYKKEKNYKSNDDYGDPEEDGDVVHAKKKKAKKNKAKKHKSDVFDDEYSIKKKPKSKKKSKKHAKKSKRSKANNNDVHLQGGFQPSPHYYGYQDRRTSTPLRNHYFGESNDDLSFRASESMPVTASSESYDSDIDVFQGRDWSQCTRKINKEGLTCYYCKDADGVATQEECMYIAGNDEENPLRSASHKRNAKPNQNSKSTRQKKPKRNNAHSKAKPSTTTTTTTPKSVVTTTTKIYEKKLLGRNLQEQQQHNANTNANSNPSPPPAISSVSWQTNHNAYPHQRPRTLNRNQNFNFAPIPLMHQNQNLNSLRLMNAPYENPVSVIGGQNLHHTNYGMAATKLPDPVKTLEYTEPKNRETLKRMIKLKVSNENDSDQPQSSATNDATVFYSKVLRKF